MEAETVATVCFYRGTSLPCLAVRWDTRRPGQSWGDVPSHCAIAFPECPGPEQNGYPWMLYEYVAGGWQGRAPNAADWEWCVDVPLSDLSAAARFATGCAGGRYNWGEIALIALYRLLPDRWLSRWHVRQANICSAFARDVLRAGGWASPGWLARQYCPASPNDLWIALKPPGKGDADESECREGKQGCPELTP